jgi:hypothetical protein
VGLSSKTASRKGTNRGNRRRPPLHVVRFGKDNSGGCGWGGSLEGHPFTQHVTFLRVVHYFGVPLPRGRNDIRDPFTTHLPSAVKAKEAREKKITNSIASVTKYSRRFTK